ncbi:hypothetical protein D3C81_1472450 [compost metagenome]
MRCNDGFASSAAFRSTANLAPTLPSMRSTLPCSSVTMRASSGAVSVVGFSPWTTIAPRLAAVAVAGASDSVVPASVSDGAGFLLPMNQAPITRMIATNTTLPRLRPPERGAGRAAGRGTGRTGGVGGSAGGCPPGSCSVCIRSPDVPSCGAILVCGSGGLQYSAGGAESRTL